MGGRYAAMAARRRLKTALASVYPYAVPCTLTEIMRTAVDLETSAQPISFCGGSQEVWAKIFAKCNSEMSCQAPINVLLWAKPFSSKLG
jgi:hypothetical protein